MTQYCDDTTLFLSDEQSVRNLLDLLAHFKDISGLELNTSKCNIMWLGPLRYRVDSIADITAVAKVKILGAWFSATAQCQEDNVSPVVKKIGNVINMWSQRNLTIKGKIVVTKSLLASQLVYIASYCSIAETELCRIQSLIMKFIWRGRPPKVSKQVLCQDIKHGGLNAVDVSKFCAALRMNWVKRMSTNPESDWRRLLQSRLGDFYLNDFLRIHKCWSFLSKQRIPKFYKKRLKLSKC